MIRLIKIYDSTENATLKCSAEKIAKLQSEINNEFNAYEWTFNKDSVLFKNDFDFQTYLEVKFIRKIKRLDKIDVDKNYFNEFGNSCHFIYLKKDEPLTVSYLFGEKSGSKIIDVVIIENYEDFSIDHINFFSRLIRAFNPTHGALTNEIIVHELLHFKAQTIWSGMLTFISNELEIEIPDEFNFIEIEAIGRVIYINDTNIVNIVTENSIKEIEKIYNYLNK